MKKFLRENPTIAFGLGLPLLLVVAFLLISGIPALLVPPPQYDVLYATEYYGNQIGVQISVVNKKVQVIYQGNMPSYQHPRLWRYSPKTGAVKEVAITLPVDLVPRGVVQSSIVQPGPGAAAAEAASKITPIDVPDLADLTVDSSSIAPDGYQFKERSDGNSNDIFTGLFSYSRYRNEAALTKSGRSIRLPTADGRTYYGNYTRFIGWVTP